jgi:hypothetical protein
MNHAGGDSEVEGPGLPRHTGHQFNRGNDRPLELTHPDDQRQLRGVYAAVSDGHVVDTPDLEAFAAEER